MNCLGRFDKWHKQTNTCLTCSYTDQNFIGCEDESLECNKCSLEYYLTPSKLCKSCTEIKPHCSYCSLGFCEECQDGFNWEKDQLLVLNHPGRSILDPFQNLRCGIKIISLRLKKYHSIQVPDKNVYWSVLRRTSKSNALIKKTTQSLPFCLSTSKN